MPDDLLEIICILERGEKHNPYKIIRKRNYFSLIMLRLHYVPGGHGSHDFGHRGRNGVTVTQRRGTGSTNVARRDRRDRFLNSQKICHGSRGAIDLLKCAVVERGEPNKTWRNVTDLNTTWSMSAAGRLVTRRQPKVCQDLSSSVAVCHVVLTRPHSSNLNMESKNLREMHLRCKVATMVEIIITEWTWVVSLYYRGVIAYNVSWQNIAFISLKISQCRHW